VHKRDEAQRQSQLVACADIAEDRSDVSPHDALRVARALDRKRPAALDVGVGRDRPLHVVLGDETRYEVGHSNLTRTGRPSWLDDAVFHCHCEMIA
jgi:hypothetical protein